MRLAIAAFVLLAATTAAPAQQAHPCSADAIAKAAKFLLPEDLRQLSDMANAAAAQMTDPNVKSALTSIAAVLTQR